MGMTCLGPVTDIPAFLQEAAGIGLRGKHLILGVGYLLQRPTGTPESGIRKGWDQEGEPKNGIPISDITMRSKHGGKP